MKIVLFLGAGFSAAWELPVMNRFFGVAETHPRLSQEDRTFLTAIKRKAQSGAGMIVSQINDLEHVLSFALMSQDLDRVGAEGAEPDADRLRRILALVYSKVNLDLITEHRQTLAKMVGLGANNQREQHDVTIVTTNYDLMPEIMLKPLGASIELPGLWSAYSKHDGKGQPLYRVGRHPLTLCKLHGSVNWYDYPGNQTQFRVATQQFNGQGFSDEQEPFQYVLPEACFDDYAPPGPPIIVPPTLFKMQADIRFDVIWKTAGKALREAQRLMFIGYSFPSSDTHMKYFIGAHLANNPSPPDIQILDPNAGAICEKLRADKLFGPHFRDYLRPVPMKWQEYSDDIPFIVAG